MMILEMKLFNYKLYLTSKKGFDNYFQNIF